MGKPRLLVVDVAAVQTELDTLREDWLDEHKAALRRRGHALDSDQETAEQAWADAYPALELLRDEIR